MNYDLNMVIGSNGNNNISSILNNSDSNSSTSTVAGSSGNVNEVKKSDSKESKQPFPFGMCKVCGDQATGVHYGIATCEGCKVSHLSNMLYFLLCLIACLIIFHQPYSDLFKNVTLN
jgi:hypothetical protein